ncbi:MAG: AAA family ATPase [Armatimonadota bacterium]
MSATEQDSNSRAIESLPPAYFLSLTVANFRCFGKEPQTLDLSDGNGKLAQWTVLLGENGVGKTTLLQCLAGMQPVKVKNVQTLETEFLPSAIHYLSRFNFLFDRAGKADPKSPYIRNSETLFLSSNFAYGHPLSKLGSSFITASFELDGDSLIRGFHKLPEDEDVSGLICYGYGASRRSRQASLAKEIRENPSDSLFDTSAELINVEEWLLQTNYATIIGKQEQKTHAKNRYAKIKNFLTGGILPDVSDFRFSTSDDTRMTPRVEAKTPYGWVRVSELSYGYKTALTWMVDFASRLFDRYPNSENPLAEPAVVLVDEIDLHLHPKWQRDLVQKLTETFPNTQFIVTAHSPLIVQAAPNANLALLRREGDHVVIDNDVDEIRNWRVDQILTSDLFGLETARPPQVAAVLEERRRILSQQTLSNADRQRLAELEKTVDDFPVGETPAELRAQDALQRAVALLKRDSGK